MAGAPPSVQLLSEDRDLDDAELWAAIDSAVASKSAARSRKPLADLRNSPRPAVNQLSPAPSPQPQKQLVRNPRSNYMPRDNSRAFPDGEVVQEEQLSDSRPQKMARFVESPSCEANRMVVVRHPPPSPMVSFPSPYATPNAGNFFVQEISPVVETSPQVHMFGGGESDNMRHSLSGQFPSVSLFKQYQNSAMAILEKCDYTMISGNPFIKKSGWRKISFYFNISYEIKDKSVEFDENHNVQRAEFVVRAHMQSGRFSDGWGSCERREKKFMKPNHDIPSTAETRAKNRACQDLLGIGEYRPGANNNIR